MDTLKFLIISAFIFTVLSCDSKAKVSPEKTSIALTSSSCLSDLLDDNRIEEMISKSEIAQIINKPETAITVKDNKGNSAKYSTMIYNWAPEEERLMVMKVKAGDREIVTKSPVSNKIIVGNLSNLGADKDDPLAYFKKVWGPKTKENKEFAKKSIDRTSKNNDKVDQASAEALKKMVDNEAVTHSLPNVGDMAYWNVQNYSGVSDIKLRVLHGDMMFVVITDVSANQEEDLEIATKVAKQIVANCN